MKCLEDRRLTLIRICEVYGSLWSVQCAGGNKRRSVGCGRVWCWFKASTRLEARGLGGLRNAELRSSEMQRLRDAEIQSSELNRFSKIEFDAEAPIEKLLDTLWLGVRPFFCFMFANGAARG